MLDLIESFVFNALCPHTLLGFGFDWSWGEDLDCSLIVFEKKISVGVQSVPLLNFNITIFKNLPMQTCLSSLHCHGLLSLSQHVRGKY